MRVNLGVKIGGGFFFLIAIILFVGIMALFQMNGVEKNVSRLTNEYIEEVDIASDIERNALQTMYAMRGYSLVNDQKYLNDVKKYLPLSKAALLKGDSLAKKYPGLVRLRENIEKEDEYFSKYSELSERTEQITVKLNTAKGTLDETGRAFMTYATDFFDTQKNIADTELDNAPADTIRERLQKIKMINQIVLKGYGVRESVWEAQATRDVKLLENAMREFTSIDDIFVQLLKITNHTQNRARLEAAQNALHTYRDALTDFRSLWIERENVNAPRGKIAEDLLLLVEETAKAGIAQTHKISEGAVAALSSASSGLIIGVVIGVILSLGTSVVLTRIITKPLFKGVALAQAMAEGDLTQTIVLKQNDELGVLADALNEMVSNLRSMLGRVSVEVASVSSSSVSLASIAEQMTHGVTDSVQRANQVATAAEHMSSNQISVAAAMEQAATNVNTVATATEEMSATIGEIAANSSKAKIITDQAVRQAAAASAKVNELGVAANEINKVTETITAISSQTNLLALNATIEAARAGEAGRGFAVVANEIKELAQQTARATEEIRSKIQGIQKATNLTVGEIGEISNVISDVDSIVATIAAAVEEQSVTTREIADNVGQASTGIAEVNAKVAQDSSMSGDIAKDIAGVTTQANETLLASEQVKLSASSLSDTATNLETLVSRFKLSA